MFLTQKALVFVLFVLFCQTLHTAKCLDEPNVQIKETRIIGKYSYAKFKGYTKTAKIFLGIPYAEQPSRSYRFQKPERMKSLPSEIQATEFKPGCLQLPPGVMPFDVFPENQSEECLYLNVFVPVDKPDQEDGFAVMVFIHGGGFIFGSGNMRAEYLSTHGNVIVVTINYRLGIFGFLSTGDREAPGNLGLWDQRLALQWVNENIAAFGGDNKRVTIFGESAGSISVIYQALYPPNKGLFQRVIAESGVPAIKLLFQYQPHKFAKFYAEKVGCDLKNIRDLISCLVSKPAIELVELSNELYVKAMKIEDLGLAPYKDDDFIKIDPTNVADLVEIVHSEELGFYRSLDIINGFNSAEGIVMYTPSYIPVIDNPETFKPTRQQVDEEIIPIVVDTHYDKLDDQLLAMVSAMYRNWSDPDCPDKLRQKMIKLVGDLLFIIPGLQYSRLHVNSSTNVNSYMYYLTANTSKPVLQRPNWVEGSNHADDLSYVFHFRLADEVEVSVENWEYELSLDIMTYWTNFAKTGYVDDSLPLNRRY